MIAVMILKRFRKIGILDKTKLRIVCKCKFCRQYRRWQIHQVQKKRIGQFEACWGGTFF
jgi:queuine/archaeosine tRNA-ribosyltransferase